MTNTKFWPWQEQAFANWLSHSSKGTIDAVTGSGKSLLGIAAIELMKANNRADQALIVVPTIQLQRQWAEELVAEGIAKPTNIGFLGDGYEELTRPITIAVVNSIRELTVAKKLLILDECHRHMSPVNRQFITNGKFDQIMALSATPTRQDELHELLYSIAPVVYTLKPEDAVEQKLISEYRIINIGVTLTPYEEEEMSKAQKVIDDNFGVFGRNYDTVRASISHSRIAVALMKAFNRRKEILLHAHNKKVRAAALVLEEQRRRGHVPKTMIFCEYIDAAEAVQQHLLANNIPAVLYHSKLKAKEATSVMESFKSDAAMVMISVRCLDEGINIPRCEIGIVVGGTSTQRQIIQRLGRILRKADGKEATLYQLYVANSKEVDWLNKRTRAIAMASNSMEWR